MKAHMFAFGCLILSLVLFCLAWKEGWKLCKDIMSWVMVASMVAVMVLEIKMGRNKD